MLRRSCVRIAVGFMVAAGGSASADGQPEEIGMERVERVTYQANPTGLQIGFFPNYVHSGDVLRAFGPRPLERANFHKWYQYEIAPGQYDFKGAFDEGRWAHLAGADIVSNVDVFHTKRLNPQGMHAMPAGYEPDITDPETREAARAFLRAFTRAALSEVGRIKLALDYELFWFALPKTPEIRRDYRDWFVEAAELCREVEAQMGMEDRLDIGLIVNADPYDIGERLIGSPAKPHHTPQEWLLDCVRASDFLGIDTYAGGSQGSKTPVPQLRAIRFWIKHYALDRPVFVTESGFSTAHQHDRASSGYHARGTEDEQARFYDMMFDALIDAKRTPVGPLARLRGYCIWMYRDWPDDRSVLERHFGITRADGTPKPAFDVVGRRIEEIETDPTLTPIRIANRDDITAELLEGDGAPVRRRSGTSYDTIEVIPKRHEFDGPTFIEVSTEHPVCLIASVNGARWAATHPHERTRSRLRLPIQPGEDVKRVTLMFTSSVYPMETRVTDIGLYSAEEGAAKP